MRNPWTKKNPLLSMCLSAANTATGPARGAASATLRRQVKATQADATRQIIDFWSGKPHRAPAKKKPT